MRLFASQVPFCQLRVSRAVCKLRLQLFTTVHSYASRSWVSLNCRLCLQLRMKRATTSVASNREQGEQLQIGIGRGRKTSTNSYLSVAFFYKIVYNESD